MGTCRRFGGWCPDIFFSCIVGEKKTSYRYASASSGRPVHTPIGSFGLRTPRDVHAPWDRYALIYSFPGYIRQPLLREEMCDIVMKNTAIKHCGSHRRKLLKYCYIPTRRASPPTLTGTKLCCLVTEETKAAVPVSEAIYSKAAVANRSSSPGPKFTEDLKTILRQSYNKILLQS